MQTVTLENKHWAELATAAKAWEFELRRNARHHLQDPETAARLTVLANRIQEASDALTMERAK